VQDAVAEFAIIWVPFAMGKAQLKPERETAGTTVTVAV
jgi:hypothetical protein